MIISLCVFIFLAFCFVKGYEILNGTTEENQEVQSRVYVVKNYMFLILLAPAVGFLFWAVKLQDWYKVTFPSKTKS